jgi:valyl-tRNA synthetase
LALPNAAPVVKERAKRHEETISRLARLDSITFPKATPKGAAVIVVGDATAALPLGGVIDAEAEAKRLGREIEKAESDLAKMDAKLSNPQFMAKAKEEAVEEARERKAELEGAIKRLRAAVRRLETVS